MVHYNSNLRVRHQRLDLIGKLADEGIVIVNGNIRYDIDREMNELYYDGHTTARIPTAALKPANSTLAIIPIQLVRMIS